MELFSFKGTKDMYNTKAFKILANKKVGLFNRAVSKLHELHVILPYLRKLGKDHVNFGVVPQYYELFKANFHKTLKLVLGSAYTSDVHNGW